MYVLKPEQKLHDAVSISGLTATPTYSASFFTRYDGEVGKFIQCEVNWSGIAGAGALRISAIGMVDDTVDHTSTAFRCTLGISDDPTAAMATYQDVESGGSVAAGAKTLWIGALAGSTATVGFHLPLPRYVRIGVADAADTYSAGTVNVPWLEVLGDSNIQ